MKLYAIGDKENLPEDYHCECEYCKKYKGVIYKSNGDMFSARKRIGYRKLSSHIAKTPFGIALFAVETFTKEGDYILDPTMGIGTSGVEAKKQGRIPIGIELNPHWGRVAAFNMQGHPGKHKMHIGNVLDWRSILQRDPPVQMIINNPPYSGDENVSIKVEDGEIVEREQHAYSETYGGNLAFLKENKKYWEIFRNLYNGLAEEKLLTGGYFVIGVKDMVNNKKPYLLHKKFCDIMDKKLFRFTGTWLLPHYPRTLFMNTYPKWYPEVKVPMYQTICVFQRREK
jgi:DNA modification methylase